MAPATTSTSGNTNTSNEFFTVVPRLGTAIGRALFMTTLTAYEAAKAMWVRDVA